MILAYQYFQPYKNDEEDMGYVDLTKTGAIVPPVLPLDVKFNISSSMIRLLYLKGTVDGSPTDDTNMHLENFIGICISYTILEVDL